jgi:hypothetical protein
MGKVTSIVKDAVRDAKVGEARGESDTIKLWENYRDQALLWRSLALLQIPATFVAVVIALMLWQTRVTQVHVPRLPMPGVFNTKELPDELFVERATDFLGLIATYTPAVARQQFGKAREMMGPELLSLFDLEMFGTELKAIENTSRTQVFFVDPTKTMINRNQNVVKITFQGERTKFVAGKELPSQRTKFSVSMTTIPKNSSLNPYGIIVTGIETDKAVRN